MKVLIVDDSKLMRDRLLKMLEDRFDKLILMEADTLDAARELLLKNLFKVVILDIKMKGETGIELLKELKQKYPDIVVVMFTNYPYPQFSRKCWGLGADYFLEKSHDFELIPEIISKQMQ
jgi:DNA-binding NarL/FixJ family response regulator